MAAKRKPHGGQSRKRISRLIRLRKRNRAMEYFGHDGKLHKGRPPANDLSGIDRWDPE